MAGRVPVAGPGRAARSSGRMTTPPPRDRCPWR